jgi:hypothetical protein
VEPSAASSAANLSKAREASPSADTFATRLAAEEQSVSDAPPVRPVRGAASSDGPLAADDLIERVTERVLERLSDRAVRESAPDIVSRIAERVVREEIERIKSSIK